MDAVTYPDDKVAEFINTNLIPLRVKSDSMPLSKDFNVTWTPTLVTLDQDGKEHYRTVGFIAPSELTPSLLLGIAKVHFDAGKFDSALECLEKIISGYPKSKAAPEAVFLRGVARYKSTHDAKPLKGAYEKLQADYPGSEWAERAQPYRLL
jgi:tetratricopeptide (TPR) repeat protein